MTKPVLAVLLIMMPATAAIAQDLSFTGAEKVFGPAPAGAPYFTIPGGTPVDGSNTFIPVAVPGTNGGYLAVGDVLGGISKSVSRKVADGTALAASITILPPNPSDKLGLTFGGATTDGRSAGSASASYRVSNRALVFAAGARSKDHTLAKGGASFSFP